jgi:hypothetical protein
MPRSERALPAIAVLAMSLIAGMARSDRANERSCMFFPAREPSPKSLHTIGLSSPRSSFPLQNSALRVWIFVTSYLINQEK